MKNASSRPESSAPDLGAFLNTALGHHQAGRLPEAEGIYRQILAQDSNHPDAWHLLGLIACQVGRYDVAVEMIKRAVAIQGNAAPFHYNLGNAYLGLGQGSAAAPCYERALELQPNYAEAHNNLGLVLRGMNKPEDAARHLRRALEISPRYVDAFNNLGLVYKEQNRFDDAKAQFERALSIKADYVAALNNLGALFRSAGKLDEAIAHYERAIEIKPNYLEALNNLGNALRDQGRLDDARARLEQALALAPNAAETLSNLGNALKDLGQLDEALTHYERAAAAKPDFAIAAYNLGAVHQEKGAFDLALAHYERALALDPTYADAHWNESLIYLLQGDFAKGLPKYEWRWRRNNAARNPFAAPMWDGGDLNGKSILLHSEQGLGDSLQFIRYASLVKKRGAKVFVYCPAALARLFESAKGIDQIFTEKTPALPGFDCQAPLMSLPWLCGTTLATIPAFAPYLAAPRDARDLWAEKLRPYAGLKIGLVWAGSPRENNPEAYAVDRRRSLRLEMFAPLASLPGIHFFSLQKGDPAKQARTPPQGMELIDLMEEVQDFADTAALIAQLDLVIGVDTSVIHVAGALAKPVWVLSRFDGCWRWLQDRSDSPWYPTLRLFRQKTPRDWAPVIQDVAAALKVFTPADKRTDLS